MSASFFDMMKYASTGIASPSMTAYDKMRALAAFGGGKTRTLTGVPPLSFKADGTPLISWSMKGNGQQSGTPTPDAPIMPTFCGVRTGNLFNPHAITAGRPNDTTGTIVYTSDTTIHDASINSITFSTSVAWRGFTTDFIQASNKLSVDTGSFVGNDGAMFIGFQYAYAQDKSFLGRVVNNVPEGTQFIRVSFQCNIIVTNAVVTNIMINSGSTPLPYEPYGWKIPITNTGQTTPVYLGEVPTVRRIVKEEIPGDSIVGYEDRTDFVIVKTRIVDLKTAGNKLNYLCSHFKVRGTDVSFTAGVLNNNYNNFYNMEFGLPTTITSLNEAKAWFDSKKAAGTPVTIWYVLATPTTGIVNEPLAKIGDYADELRSEDAGVTIPTVKGSNTLMVDTELQPSEMSVTGHIKSS